MCRPANPEQLAQRLSVYPHHYQQLQPDVAVGRRYPCQYLMNDLDDLKKWRGAELNLHFADRSPTGFQAEKVRHYWEFCENLQEPGRATVPLCRNCWRLSAPE
jgi:hypothetical protein